MNQNFEKIFNTKYGKFIIPEFEEYFIKEFNKGLYWDENELTNTLSLIDKNKNVLEFGSHLGTNTIPYANHIEENCVVYSFEPQKKIYNILQKNIINNNLQHKIISKNASLFYYDGVATMNEEFLDGSSINQKSIDAFDNGLYGNYGGLSLGKNGENTECFKIDSLNLENLGFIHSDAQGAEPFILWGAKETIKKYRPIILYEDINLYGDYLYRKIIESYNIPEEISNFDISEYCLNELNYKYKIDKDSQFNSILIP
jgi:FkbM family methyltransferase